MTMNMPFEVPTQVESPCLLDFYKCFHASAYKEGVEEVSINFTGRSGNHSNLGNNTHYMWAGLQGAIASLTEVWSEFFEVSVEQAVATYKRVNEGGLGRECDTSRLEALHALGYLPLEFRALPEGVAVPYGVPAFVCTSTHKDFFWLPNFLETFLSAEIWPVQTSLTTASAYMKTVQKYVAKDGSPDFLIPFLCHDFSMRGMMGARVEGGASLSGVGHLMSGFAGSDTLPAALKAEKHYGAYLGLDRQWETIASVDATEHSVQCSFNNDDLAYFRHCMHTASPTGILSLVSDGYDFWKLVTEVLPVLKDEIMAREGKVVIRPDSGCPVDVLCGTVNAVDMSKCESLKQAKAWMLEQIEEEVYEETPHGECGDGEPEGCMFYDGKYYSVVCDFLWNRHDKQYYFIDETSVKSCEEMTLTADQKGLIEVLWEIFGGTETEQGYKLLDEHIGAIYGDSITLERQKEIYKRLNAKGFAVANTVLGVGSYSYQYVTRDTHGSAVKATNMVLNGVDTPIQKEVKGDAVKKSAKGLLFVDCEDDEYVLHDNVSRSHFESTDNCLETVWCDGVWMRIQTLNDVRQTVAGELSKL